MTLTSRRSRPVRWWWIVGCGDGEQLGAVERKHCRAVGAEPSISEAEVAFSPGVRVVRATAEDLPFPDQTFDGAICKVVTPYTDEPKCIAEVARVTRAGGVVVLCHSGGGYYFRYVLQPPGLRVAFYTARRALRPSNDREHVRLPRHGLLGAVAAGKDRIQSAASSAATAPPRAWSSAARRTRRFLGAPVFIYDVVERGERPYRTGSSGCSAADDDRRSGRREPEQAEHIGIGHSNTPV
jgi:SAM-dependent methyltransferase